MKYLKTDKRLIRIYAFALCFLLFAVITGVMLGSSGLVLSELKELFLSGKADSPSARILLYVRLPRVLAGILCGGALAVSGAVIQNVLANPLASPSVIGVNAGAGLAVTIASAAGLQGGFGTSLFAFVGAVVAVMTVSLGAKKWGASKSTVILMGVAMNSLLGAFSDTVITLVPEVGIMRNDFRIGDFSFVTYNQILPAVLIIIPVIIVIALLSNELEVLSLGEENALSLGLNAPVMRIVFLLLSALLAGVAVSIAGLLSFVGLVVPHIVRRLAGAGSRQLIVLSALLGAGFVTFCDTLSRVLFAPYELPVGIIMAFLGAPFFLFILFRGKGERAYA